MLLGFGDRSLFFHAEDFCRRPRNHPEERAYLYGSFAIKVNRTRVSRTVRIYSPPFRRNSSTFASDCIRVPHSLPVLILMTPIRQEFSSCFFSIPPAGLLGSKVLQSEKCAFCLGFLAQTKKVPIAISFCFDVARKAQQQRLIRPEAAHKIKNFQLIR